MKRVRMLLAALVLAATAAACGGDITGPAAETEKTQTPMIGSGSGT